MSKKMKTIPLTQGKVAIVDDDDYEELSKYKWHAHNRARKKPKYYAGRMYKGRTHSMHRYIISCPGDLEIDHINGDTLDNRKCNLRICSHQQNCANNKRKAGQSGYRGVWTTKENNMVKFRAAIRIKYKMTSIGTFSNAIHAAKAFDDKAIKVNGEYARLNFPKMLRRRNIYRWLMATNGRVFAVIFIKRSTGKEKKIHARVGVKTRQKGKGLRYNSSDKKLIVVYDMKERTYKSIPIDGIEAVCCRGKKYRVD